MDSKDKAPEQKMPQRFIISVDGFVPVKLQFEVSAIDADEALKCLDLYPHKLRMKQQPEINIPKMKRVKVVVKELLTSLIKITKNF